MSAYRQVFAEDVMAYRPRITVRCESYVTDQAAEVIADALAQVPGVRSVVVSTTPSPQWPGGDDDE